MLVISQNITEEIIDHLIKQIGNHIKIKELEKNMPEFLNHALVSEIKENINPLTAQNDTINRKGMNE